MLKCQNNRACADIVEKRMLHVHVPHVFQVQKPVEVPQVAYVDKIVDVSFLFAAQRAGTKWEKSCVKACLVVRACIPC